MFATAAEVQNDFGKYIDLALGQEVVITRDGLPVAKLLGMRGGAAFLSDRLVGLIPSDTDEDALKSERLAKQETVPNFV